MTVLIEKDQGRGRSYFENTEKHKMNKNGYSTVRSWRDDVSESLGSLKTMSQNIEKKMDKVCAAQGRHEDRIYTIEKK